MTVGRAELGIAVDPSPIGSPGSLVSALRRNVARDSGKGRSHDCARARSAYDVTEFPAVFAPHPRHAPPVLTAVTVGSLAHAERFGRAVGGFDDCTEYCVRVNGEQFGRAVHHEVRTKLQRPLAAWSPERVVNRDLHFVGVTPRLPNTRRATKDREFRNDENLARRCHTLPGTVNPCQRSSTGVRPTARSNRWTSRREFRSVRWRSFASSRVKRQPSPAVSRSPRTSNRRFDLESCGCYLVAPASSYSSGRLYAPAWRRR